MTKAASEQLRSESIDFDPTNPAPMTNVAEFGFEGRFQDWADDTRYFEYSRAANPIGPGHAPKVPIVRFSPEIYVNEPTGVVRWTFQRSWASSRARRRAPACWPILSASTLLSRSIPP